jgi:ABC-type bacteriocin/lantibiotic exporter with double-glycine peptidase domain
LFGNLGFRTSLIELFGSGSMLSLYDLETVFISYGFKTRLLKLDPGYFRGHPQPAIPHFSARHFVVFLGEEGGEPVIFDPLCGKVYLSWAVLSRLFSGYMLYVYNGPPSAMPAAGHSSGIFRWYTTPSSVKTSFRHPAKCARGSIPVLSISACFAAAPAV